MLTDRSSFEVAVLNGVVWAVGWHEQGYCRAGMRRSAARGFIGPTCIWHAVVFVLRCSVGSYEPSADITTSVISALLCRAVNVWTRRAINGSQEVKRCHFGLAVFRGQLWAGKNEDGEIVSSCEYLDVATNTWMAGPPMTWAVGGGVQRLCVAVIS